MHATLRHPLYGFMAVALIVTACSDSVVEPTGATPSLHPDRPAFATNAAGGHHILAASKGSLARVTADVADAGGTVVRSHPRVGILIVDGLSDAAAAALARRGGVHAVAADVMIDHPVVSMADQAEAVPASHDPSTAFFYTIGFQWDMEQIQADAAWAAGASADGITVAILDTGIDATHQDMVGLVDATRSIAFVPNANPAIPAWGDDHFHGTHVGGTVASNGIGTAGVAPHATLMAVKICGAFFGCPFSAIVSGIIHAVENDAHVINMSIGGFIGKSFPGGGQLHALLNRVINYANSAGVVVASAAGNGGFDLQHLGRDFGAGSFVAVPCESGNGMCVSATNILDEPTGYTNYGTSAISVAAPGGDGLFPVLAPCSTQSVFLPAVVGFSCGPANYLFVTGTSMATPHVAGAAALVAGGGVTNPGRIKARLQNTADDLGAPGADPFYGKGRLNVFRAVND